MPVSQEVGADRLQINAHITDATFYMYPLQIYNNKLRACDILS